MCFISKYHKFLILIFFLNILISCKLQEPTKNHGILFLENRSNQLKVNSNNKNDVIRIIGHPHTTSVDTPNDWIYIERVLTKGSFHKFGQNVVKSNNVLVLSFDKYGILKNKIFLDKNNLEELKFSKKITENDLSKKSFVQSFLSSIKAKMYGNKR